MITQILMEIRKMHTLEPGGAKTFPGTEDALRRFLVSWYQNTNDLRP